MSCYTTSTTRQTDHTTLTGTDEYDAAVSPEQPKHVGQGPTVLVRPSSLSQAVTHQSRHEPRKAGEEPQTAFGGPLLTLIPAFPGRWNPEHSNHLWDIWT